ncbi:hypothetical protein HDU88_006799 [Geranomyces variabilis]|nr:hypothetical protein HDU88_006799 [Geranomyces variabilis]
MPAAVASPPSAVHSTEFVRACSGSSAGFRPVTSANGGNLSNPARHLPPRPTSTTATNATATSASQSTQPRPPSVPAHHPQQQAPSHSPRSAARISALERTIEYMQVQHTASLKGLHEEVAKLQLTCSDLSLELVKTKALVASSSVSNADDDALREIIPAGIYADISKPTDASTTNTTTITASALSDRSRAELPPVTRASHPPTGRGRGRGILNRRLLDSPSQSAAALAAEEILAAYVAAATGEGNAAAAVGAAASAKLVVLPPIRYDAVASEEEEAAEHVI